MGLSLSGSLLWALGLSGSLAWPGLVALGFTRLRWTHISVPTRFLRYAIPLSYTVIFCAHALLADFVIVGAERAAETGLLSAVWWRIIFVLVLETALAATALYWLERRFRPGATSP